MVSELKKTKCFSLYSYIKLKLIIAAPTNHRGFIIWTNLNQDYLSHKFQLFLAKMCEEIFKKRPLIFNKSYIYCFERADGPSLEHI